MDIENINYLKTDNWDIIGQPPTSNKTFLKHFYNTPSDFYSVKTKDFTLRINPVFYGSAGNDSQNGYTFLNTRGIELKGNIDNKIGFYTILTDNQAILPKYVEEQISLYKLFS